MTNRQITIAYLNAYIWNDTQAQNLRKTDIANIQNIINAPDKFAILTNNITKLNDPKNL